MTFGCRTICRRIAALFRLAILLPGAALAGGTGNNLLPDIPVGAPPVKLQSIANISPDIVMDITHAGDGSGRLFIVSPHGVIRIYQNGSLLPTPFLNAPASPPDRAMSGLAFHPNYADNGKFYVITGDAVPNPSTPHYSPPQDDTASAFDNLLVEYQVDANNPNLADPASKRELLRVHQAHREHNMDDLAFGGDGYLYIAMGDGGATRTGTPTHYNTTASQTTNPYGAVLRIDVDGIGPNGRYAIPPDNPFASGAGGNVPEVFAWGVRNPWRISADRLTGEMYTGVNGDNTIEQVYRIELSRNYGWDNKEGSFLWNPVTGDATADPNPDPQFASPLAEYDHNATGAAFGSVIGGFVYRGTAMPEFCGRYFFFDWLAGKVIAMNIHTGALEIVPVDPAGAQLIPTLDITWGEDESGELYIGRASGEILKLVSTFSPARPAGDIDLDGDVDLADAESLAECLGGPDVYTLPPGCPAAHFDLADVTCDNDVDLYDFAVLQQILTNRPSGAK